MWQLVRPDAVFGLEVSLVKKLLPRYIKVVKNELPANFQILKRISVKQKTKNFWQVHEDKMKEFYELKEKIDSKEVKLEDLKIPKFSLLDLKIQLVKKIMESCDLCERNCKVNRWKGEIGVCKVGNKCLISSEFVHLGEEPHITPSHTIFFMGCPFKCQFCQNWEISQWYETGIEVTPEFLARAIEKRRKMDGVRNVNFVGGEPTPHLYWILLALKNCKVNIPTLWNSDMYMTEKTMKILDGVIDMYLSDFKYGNDKCALRLSIVSRFFEVCSRNHLLASKQAEITLRHLILPNHIECCTKPVLKWIAENIKDKCLVNLMDQYYPCWQANKFPEINRKITLEEFKEAVDYAKSLGLNFII
ncbi:MAG: radical SAM protein [Candidatus Aenigmatarchaeota archaeon]